MPISARRPRSCASSMFVKRMGGRVSLFNYNPSIAGGKIGVKRFHKAHRMGPILRRNKQEAKTMIQGAVGQGLSNPGHHIGGLMGAPPMSSMHGDNAAKKRVFAAISEHLGGKRHKAA